MSLLPGKFYLDDFFDDFSPISKMSKMDFMKCDVYEKGGEVHIEMDIPGYSKEDISINVDEGILTIEASHDDVKEDEEKNYYRKERVTGSFKRQFTVGSIEEDKIKAKFNNGVLTVSFPKEEKKETKKFIEIK
ncbi:MAG: Hsp20/alpha crystallin family protein [bacterium]|nr:Hsp20/alpha crystallin family protein [bacterium]